LNLDFLQRLSVSGWIAVLGIVATLAIGYLTLRKPRWKKYRCRGLPYDRIFREKEYGHDPKIFLTDVGSLNRNFKMIEDWHTGKTKPLLVKGTTGVGKSRFVTEFLRELSFWERLRRRVLMPTVNDVREKKPPRFARWCILFLNDIHEYRDPVNDSRLYEFIQNKRFKIIATIPSEMYDPSWSVLQSYLWDEIRVEQWTEEEGRRLAKARNIAFDVNAFTGTPLSVIAPASEMRRRFDLLPPDRKAVLESLKVIKTYLGCFTTFELASALTVPSGKFDNYAFTDVTVRQGLWCRTDSSAAILADGVSDSIRYDVSIRDALGLQDILMRDEKPVKRRDEYLFYLGNSFLKLGNFDRALLCYDRSKDLSPSNPVPWFSRGQALISLDKAEDALKSYNQAKKLFQREGNRSGIAAALHQLGTIEQRRRHYADAIEFFNESIDNWRAANNELGASLALHHLGMIEETKPNPDYSSARIFYNLSLGIKRRLGARPETAVTLYRLARLALKEDKLNEARLLCDESLGILKESRDSAGIASALYLLHQIEYRKGNYIEAKKLYDQSIEARRKPTRGID
jgi:tetratricopeptide (TPR) repeat protein